MLTLFSFRAQEFSIFCARRHQCVLVHCAHQPLGRTLSRPELWYGVMCPGTIVLRR